jgi:phenylacetate-CoA ligase
VALLFITINPVTISFDMNEVSPKKSFGAEDFITINKLHEHQSERLQKILNAAYRHIPFYRHRLDSLGVMPTSIKSIADLSKLPFFDKSDLQAAYPLDMLAVPVTDVVCLYSTCNTQYKPFTSAYTESDIDMMSSVTRRIFSCCGIKSGDIIQNANSGRWFNGVCKSEIAGAVMIATAGASVLNQIKLLKEFEVTVFCSTPSYFNYIIEQSTENGIDLSKLPLRIGILGAEQWTEEMRDRIEKVVGIKTFDIYGISEINGTGLAVECEHHNGMHIFEDHFYPEIINPVNGEVLHDGTAGELVITTLSMAGMPLLRYRTGDITRIIPGQCICGRTMRRIDRISSRRDDNIVIRGVNISPSIIESSLLSVEGTLPYYNIVLYTENGVDSVEVDVEITEELFSDKVRVMEVLQQKLADAIKQSLGIYVKVKLVAPRTINREAGNTRRIFDHRRR